MGRFLHSPLTFPLLSVKPSYSFYRQSKAETNPSSVARERLTPSAIRIQCVGRQPIVSEEVVILQSGLFPGLVESTSHTTHSPSFSKTKSDPAPPRSVSGCHRSSIGGGSKVGRYLLSALACTFERKIHLKNLCGWLVYHIVHHTLLEQLSYLMTSVCVCPKINTCIRHYSNRRRFLQISNPGLYGPDPASTSASLLAG